ncbi:Transcription elongation factor S-II [Entamoeba marina]
MSRKVATKPIPTNRHTNPDPTQTAIFALSKIFSEDTSVARDISQCLTEKYNGDVDELANSLSSKQLSPQELVEMKISDLATADIKKRKEEIRKEEEDKKKPMDISKIPDSTTDKCRKCGSRKIMESLVQTRSADEPMTRILTCAQCGHGWKMSC